MAELSGKERTSYRQKTIEFQDDLVTLSGTGENRLDTASRATDRHAESLDAADIKGNELAKRQLLVAAAGRHLHRRHQH